MVLYGGIEYGNTPGGGTPSGGTPGGGVPSGGSGPVGPLVGGLGNLGNLLLGYLGGGGLGPGSQAGQTPTGGQPGTPPPTQHPNPTPGGVPVVVVGDPGSGGGNGSGNNSGNSYQSNEVNIPGFGNVSFNAPSLPPITPAQFGNSPPLSLIAQLTNPNFQAGGGGAPTYDTNVGNSGSVQGAPGQMMEQRRDSPSGPAAPQMPGPAGGELRQNPNGVVLGSRGPAQMDTPPQAPPRQLLAASQGVSPGAPPMPGGMPPFAPQPPGGAGATESPAQYLKRIKDKMRRAYQAGILSPEDMAAMNGLTDEAPAPFIPPINHAPAMPLGRPTTPQSPKKELSNVLAAVKKNGLPPAGLGVVANASKQTMQAREAQREAPTPEPATPEPEPSPEQLPWETDPTKASPYGANHPALNGDPRARNQAALQARASRDQEIEQLEGWLGENPNPNDMRGRQAQLTAAHQNRASHPTGSNSPLINGIASHWNRWKYGAQADPHNAPYQAQAQLNAEMKSEAHQARVKEYNDQRDRLRTLYKERDNDAIAQENEDRTNQEQQATAQQQAIADQRRDAEKRLAMMPPGPEKAKAIQEGVNAGYFSSQNQGALTAMYHNYDKAAAEKEKQEADKRALDYAYDRDVKGPAGKLRLDSATALAPSKAERLQLQNEQTRLDIEAKKFRNGELDERRSARFIKDADAHNRAVKDLNYKDYIMAGGAVDDYDKQLTLDARRTAGGMLKPGQIAGQGITDPVQKAAAIAKSQEEIQGQLAGRAKALDAKNAAREKAMSANVAQAVSAGDPNKAYYEQVKTSMADGSHTRAELEAGLSKRGLSIKALEAKYGPIGKPGAK